VLGTWQVKALAALPERLAADAQTARQLGFSQAALVLENELAEVGFE